MTVRAERGQSAVEFALLLPLLALLVMGMVDFARALFSYQAVANSAREGARYCALYRTANNIDLHTRVQGELGTLVTASAITVKREPSGPSGNQCNLIAQTGSDVTVTVKANFIPITPLVSQFAGSSLVLGANATMVVVAQ